MDQKKKTTGIQIGLPSELVKYDSYSELSSLADRMRPQRLDEFVGQKHLVGNGRLISRLVKKKVVQSLVFWGPPGCGKTTLAHIIAHEWDVPIVSLSAVLSGLKEVREAISKARGKWQYQKTRTILFIDEIHRFNKAQQDALLPHVEKGTIVLFGATTENPSFSIIAPLLSRVKILKLEPLCFEDLKAIIEKAVQDKEKGLGTIRLRFESGALERLIHLSDSDARVALNLLELTALSYREETTEEIKITLEMIEEVCQEKHLLYDKSGEEHFNLISALHKSLRGSDPDAGLYYLARMLLAGEDPLYIGRRLIRFALEDVGLADPRALSITVDAVKAFQILGHPEGELALAEAVVYLATAPKSNAIYKAYGVAQEAVQEKGALPVPLKLRNAPTRLMEKEGYGKGYKYPHDYEGSYINEDYLPKALSNARFYYPTEHGEEKKIKERLKCWREKDSS